MGRCCSKVDVGHRGLSVSVADAQTSASSADLNIPTTSSEHSDLRHVEFIAMLVKTGE